MFFLRNFLEANFLKNKHFLESFVEFVNSIFKFEGENASSIICNLMRHYEKIPSLELELLTQVKIQFSAQLNAPKVRNLFIEAKPSPGNCHRRRKSHLHLLNCVILRGFTPNFFMFPANCCLA